MRANRLYAALAFAGATPFLACALLPFGGINEVPPLGALDYIAGSYGLAIICFLAGTHWAMFLLRPSESPFNLFVSSNVVFLAAWFAFVLASLQLALAIQIAAFLVLLFIEGKMLQSGLLTRHYLRIRSIATGVAVVSLAIIVSAS